MSTNDRQLENEIATLRQMLLERDHELKSVRDRFELQTQDNQTLQSQIALQTQTIREQALRQEQLEHRIQQLLKQLYGSRRERFIDPDQLLLFDEDDLKALAQEARDQEREEKQAVKTGKKRPGHGRGPLPEHLPREVVRHELPEQDRACPCCGEVRAEIGHESSEQLEYIPAVFKVLVHQRVKYACRKCQEHVETAAGPAKPIEKGLPGPGLLAWTVVGKFGDHLPLYRQEEILARLGVIIRRSTLCDWIASASTLLEAIYRRMAARVLQSRVIHTDDTSVKQLEAGRGTARTARFWGYLGDEFHPYIVYDFTESRKRDGPAKFLSGYEGYMQADAYGGYDGIFAGGKVLEVACWAHARRKWDDIRTIEPDRSHFVLALVQKLYAIEREIKGAFEAEKLAQRQVRSLPILAELESWLEAEGPKLLPKSLAGQAAAYMTNQWQALKRYCDSGILSIDNNAAERAMKPCAIGRKNWLFVASKTGGERAAVLMSLIQTCKQNEVEPWAYLRDLFELLPKLGEKPTPEALDALLPDRWLKANPQYVWRINQARQKNS
jgi:transposase